jgi:hypothetical protein
MDRIFIFGEQRTVHFLAEQLAQGSRREREARSLQPERTVPKTTNMYITNRNARVGYTPYHAGVSYSGPGSFEDTLRRCLPMSVDAPVSSIPYSPDFTLVNSGQPQSNAQGTPPFIPALPPQAINPSPFTAVNPFDPWPTHYGFHQYEPAPHQPPPSYVLRGLPAAQCEMDPNKRPRELLAGELRLQKELKKALQRQQEQLLPFRVQELKEWGETHLATQAVLFQPRGWVKFLLANPGHEFSAAEIYECITHRPSNSNELLTAMTYFIHRHPEFNFMRSIDPKTKRSPLFGYFGPQN